MEPPIRLLIVEDHALVREGIAALLREAPEIEVVGTAGDGAEALAKAHHLQPDVVLMDYNMPVINGLEATRHLHAELPELRVLILTEHDASEYVLQLMQAGAAGYILKSETSLSKLRKTIAAVRDGIFVFPPVCPSAPPSAQPDTRVPLSSREMEVLRLTAQGKSAKEIGRIMGIDSRTVETHRQNIREKLGIRTIAELTRYAVAHGVA